MRDVLSLAVALGVASALLRGLRPLARRIGLVARPRVPAPGGDVPLIGGLAMFVGFAMGALTLDASLAPLRPFFAGAALLVVVGVLDDLRELSSRARFAAQIVAAAMMVGWGGVVLLDLGRLAPGGEVLSLHAAAVPFSVFCAVGVINALNMVDGVDGLAGALALVALAALAWVAHRAGLSAHRDVLVLLAAVVVAFLAVNARLPWQPRARAYMGDAGSLFLGFAITWFVIDLSQGPAPAMAPVTALWLLLVPLFDTVWLLVKRPLEGRWPTEASHDHLHHLLQMAGMAPGRCAAVLGAVAAAAAAAGLLAESAGVAESHRFQAFLALFAVYAVLMHVSWRRGRLLARDLDRRAAEPRERRAGGERRRRRGTPRRGAPRE